MPLSALSKHIVYVLSSLHAIKLAGFAQSYMCHGQKWDSRPQSPCPTAPLLAVDNGYYVFYGARCLAKSFRVDGCFR